MAAVLPLIKHVRRRLSCCSAWEGAAARYLDSLKNFEKQGVPKGAGTDTPEGFDLDRMRRLLGRLDDPHLRLCTLQAPRARDPRPRSSAAYSEPPDSPWEPTPARMFPRFGRG